MAHAQSEDFNQAEKKMIRMINGYGPESLTELKSKILDPKKDIEDRLFSLYLLQLSQDPLKNQLLVDVIQNTDGKIKDRAIKYKNDH